MVRVLCFTFVLLFPSSSFAQTSSRVASVPTASEAAQADVSLMEYVGGSPLSLSEKQSVVPYAEAGLSRDPKGWTQGYLNAKASLALATYHNAFADGQSRENWRRDFENFAANDPERVIMDKHDPVLASRKDANGHVSDIVTEHSLHVLLEAAAWAFSGAGLPAPAPDLFAREQIEIRQNYASYSPDLQSAYAHIGSDFPAARAFLASVRPAEAQAFLKAQLEKARPDARTLSQGAAVALLAQQLTREVRRRGLNPVKLCLMQSGDPLMKMYTYNAYHDAWSTMNR